VTRDDSHIVSPATNVSEHTTFFYINSFVVVHDDVYIGDDMKWCACHRVW